MKSYYTQSLLGKAENQMMDKASISTTNPTLLGKMWITLFLEKILKTAAKIRFRAGSIALRHSDNRGRSEHNSWCAR